jgi:hypothetical protein
MSEKKKKGTKERKYTGYTEPLARDSVIPKTDEYACPENGCNTRWIRSELGEQILMCDQHRKVLTKTDAG